MIKELCCDNLQRKLERKAGGVPRMWVCPDPLLAQTDDEPTGDLTLGFSESVEQFLLSLH